MTRFVQRLTHVLDAVLTRALVLLMLALVVAVLWQVISRYVFSAPSSWTEEAARFLLIWITLLGAVYAYRTGMHLGLDLLPKKLGAAAARRLARVTAALVVLFAAAVLVVGGGSLVRMTWELEQYSAVLGLPMSFVYAVIPVAGVLICAYALAALADPTVGAPGDAVAPAE